MLRIFFRLSPGPYGPGLIYAAPPALNFWCDVPFESECERQRPTEQLKSAEQNAGETGCECIPCWLNVPDGRRARRRWTKIKTAARHRAGCGNRWDGLWLKRRPFQIPRRSSGAKSGPTQRRPCPPSTSAAQSFSPASLPSQNLRLQNTSADIESQRLRRVAALDQLPTRD